MKHQIEPSTLKCRVCGEHPSGPEGCKGAPTSKVAHIADRKNDNKLITVPDMLVDAERWAREHPEYRKAVVLLLRDDDARYDVRFQCSNMRKSEMVALLKIKADDFAGQINGFDEE